MPHHAPALQNEQVVVSPRLSGEFQWRNFLAVNPIGIKSWEIEERTTDDFFRARLDQMIDLRHPLAVLASRVPWSQMESSLAPVFARRDRKGRLSEGAEMFGPTLAVAGAGVSIAGRPRLPMRLMVALLYLKHAHKESDASLSSAGRRTCTSSSSAVWTTTRRTCQRAILGVVMREVRRKLDADNAAVAADAAPARESLSAKAISDLTMWLERAERILSQQRHTKNKLYALHASEVECMSKGKVHTPCVFGVKVSLAVIHKQGLMVGARSFRGNPYDGHVLNAQLVQTANLLQDLGRSPKQVIVDLGYRGGWTPTTRACRSSAAASTSRSATTRSACAEPQSNSAEAASNYPRAVVAVVPA